jgi:hypothetical protein
MQPWNGSNVSSARSSSGTAPWPKAITDARRDARQPLVVGIMGSGHIEYGNGVPHQLAALGVNCVAAALPWPADTDYPIHDPPIADVLFGVPPAP